MSDSIRKAARPDADGLFQLIQQHALFERNTASLSFDALNTLLSADRPPTHLLVAEEHFELIGYAAITFDFSLWRSRHYGYLDCLFVAAATRGRGVGKQLFNAAVKLAKVKGADCLEWQTPVWNTDAIRFYLRTGAHDSMKQRFALQLEC